MNNPRDAARQLGQRPTKNKNNYLQMMAPCFPPFHTHTQIPVTAISLAACRSREDADCRRLSAVESTDGMTSGYLPTLPSSCV